MITHLNRHVGRRFERSHRSDPRFLRGHQRPGFFSGHPEHHRFGSHWQQPTAAQQALRSTAAEVARLFVMAVHTSQGNVEQQAQLRSFLERSRKELSALIDGTGLQPQQARTEDGSEVEQA